jgi:hypothetical protein
LSNCGLSIILAYRLNEHVRGSCSCRKLFRVAKVAISNGNNTIAGVRLAAGVAFQVSSDHDRSDPIMSTLSANAGSAHSA